MASTVQEFWTETRGHRAEIFASIQSSPQQPKGARDLGNGQYAGSCFITSVKNRKAGMVAGDVVECSIVLAGQRIAEETHRLSSDEEIVAWRQKQATAKVEVNRREAVRKNQFLAEKIGEAR